MAIIYSYPTVAPTVDDLVLGTDINQPDKPTKNFSIQSIVDLIQGTATGLAAVLLLSNDAGQQAAVNFTNVQGTGTFTAGTFTDGTMTISNGIGAGFVRIQSTNFIGNLTGALLSTGQAGQIASAVQAITQNAGDNSTKLATTAYVDGRVDPSILTFTGTTGGNQTVNLAAQTFSLLGTTSEIKTVSTAQTLTISLADGAFGSGSELILPNGASATTQAATDDSTKVATTAFVRDYDDTQDLDFTGDTGTSSVLLNSQTLNFEGTALQVTTAVTAQKVKFSLPANVTIGGTFTGTTFAGDLLGTINTLTTGVTQPLGNDTTKIATTAFVERAAGAKTLDYAGDSTGPFTLNLTNDELEFNGDSNITITAAAVTGNKGIVTVDLNNNVTITGTSKAGTFTTTAGTATWTTTVLTGFTSITSGTFIADSTASVTNFQGNASSATKLGSSDGTIQLLAGSGLTQGVASNAVIYTNGGNIQVTTSLANTTVTAKTLLNLPAPTSTAITAGDTILAAMAKLQGQITGIPQGLVYKGTWNAATNTPTLASGTGVTGEFYIVSVAGTTNLDGITDWQIGDWAIFVEVGATDTWQKIDNSQSIIGSGATNKIAKWTAPTVLGTGLIEDDGTTVTIGANGNLTVEGDTILGDSAANDTLTVNGPGTFVSTAIFNVGIGLGGAAYGSAGQVLTSGGASGSVNTWTTPTTGTVTSVGLTETGNALTITGSPVTSSGTINIAGAGSASQYINGALDLVTFPTVDNYVSWTADSDEGTNITVTSGFNLKFTGAVTTGGAGIATDSAVSANEMTIGLINAGGTPGTTTFYRGDGQWSVPVGTKTETLAEVLTNGNTTGGTDIAVSAGDDITFTDTSKAIFGAGSDLQIYHDGSNSYIQDTSGTGDLRVDTNTFRLRSANGGETMIRAFEDGAVILSHNNLDKLTTTSTGISVTGEVVSGSSLVSKSTSTGLIIRTTTNVEPFLAIQRNSGTNGVGVIRLLDGGDLTFDTGANGAGQASRLTIDGGTGDATFEDNVEIKGNLTVDGSIIHGGGKSGIFNGSVNYTGTTAAQLFLIKRTTTGQMIFDVFLTSGTAGGSTKKYTVAHKSNTATVYNKIIETTGTPDFTVTFANTTATNTGDAVACTITPTATQTVSYTIQVGFDNANTVVVS